MFQFPSSLKVIKQGQKEGDSKTPWPADMSQVTIDSKHVTSYLSL